MSEPKSTTPDIVSSLPNGPIPREQLHELEEHDKVVSIVPMKVHMGGNVEPVYDFTIELEDVAYALRRENNEWNIIAKDEDVEVVGVALQDYHHEHGM